MVGKKEIISCNTTSSDHPETSRLLQKLKVFKLINPRGGQYNDGYTLRAEMKFPSIEMLQEFLQMIELDYALLPDKIELNKEGNSHLFRLDELHFNTSKWIKYNTWGSFNGESINVTIYNETVYLVASDWYEVSLKDVQIAILLEEKLQENTMCKFLFEN